VRSPREQPAGIRFRAADGVEMEAAGFGALWRFREDVGDDGVDFFAAGDLDEAGDETLPRLGTLVAVGD